jgi:hypothetical protein
MYTLWPSEQLIAEAQQTQETNIHALSGIRKGDPAIKWLKNLRLRLHGHRDQRNIALQGRYFQGDGFLMCSYTDNYLFLQL